MLNQNKLKIRSYFPDSKITLKAFSKIAIFGILQTFLINLNGIIDNFMVGNYYKAGDSININGIKIDNISVDVAKSANLANVSALGTISAWWIMISFLTIFIAGSIGFIVSVSYAKKEYENVSKAVIVRTLFTSLIVLLFIVLFASLQEKFINLMAQVKSLPYTIEGLASDETQKLNYVNSDFLLHTAKSYTNVIIYSWVLWIFSYCIASTLKETGKTKIPMFSSLGALLINTSLNIVFIGTLRLGVAGAAYATIISRFFDLSFLLIYFVLKSTIIFPTWSSFKNHKPIYKIYLKRIPYVIFGVIWTILVTTRPMIFNSYWSGDHSSSIASARSSLAISGTLQNLFLVVVDGIMPLIFVFVGSQLAIGNSDKAKKNSRMIMGYGIVFAIIMSLILFLISLSIPKLTFLFFFPEYALKQGMYVTWVLSLVYTTWAIMQTTRVCMTQGSKAMKIAMIDLITSLLQLALIFVIGEIKLATSSLDYFWKGYLIFYSTDILKCIYYLWVFERSEWHKPKTVVQPNIKS